MNDATSPSATEVSAGSHTRSDSHVPKSARSRQGTRNRYRPIDERPPSASSPASRFVTRFIALTIGTPADSPIGFSSRSTAAPVALMVSRAEISSVATERTLALTLTTRLPFTGGDGLDKIG